MLLSHCIGSLEPDPERVRRTLREAPLGALRDLLPDRAILDACKACGHSYRERRYGPVVTVFHFVAQAIQREESFAATWQEFGTALAADLPDLPVRSPDLSALTHARSRLPKEVLQRLAAEACEATNDTPMTRWRGFRLRALDCTTVSMPREAQLFAHFGAHRARTTTVRYPLATFAALLDVGTSLIVDYRFGPFDPAEKSTTRPLLERLGPGDLLLGDRGFSGSPTLARVRATGADFLMRKHALLKVSDLPVRTRLGKNDFISEIPISKSARREDPSLPPTVRVRLFRATWKTPADESVTEWFVTSLEDARRFKKATLGKLYHQRWRQETSYLEFKVTFHADVLRSKTVANIEKEVAAHVLAYQLVRRLIVAAARTHEANPTQTSFLNAARWVVGFSQRMAASPTSRLPDLYKRLLAVVAATSIDVRPGRLEPRALTREWKHYSHLRVTRSQWRRNRLAGAA